MTDERSPDHDLDPLAFLDEPLEGAQEEEPEALRVTEELRETDAEEDVSSDEESLAEVEADRPDDAPTEEQPSDELVEDAETDQGESVDDGPLDLLEGFGDEDWLATGEADPASVPESAEAEPDMVEAAAEPAAFDPFAFELEAPDSPAPVAVPLSGVFSDDSGAPDETLVGRDDLFDDLTRAIPLHDPEHDEAIDLEPDDVSATIAPDLAIALSEMELAARMGGELDLKDDLKPGIEDDGVLPLDMVGSGASVSEVVHRAEYDHRADGKAPRFRLWNRLWNRLFGWEGLETPTERYVAGKMVMRGLVFGLLPVLIIVGASLPFAGTGFASTPASGKDTELVYRRPLVEFGPHDTTTYLADGTPVSARLLLQLNHLYDAYWAELDRALKTGDPTPLESILSRDLYATYAAQAKDAFAKHITMTTYGAGADSRYLLIDSITPASGPEHASASTGDLLVSYLDPSGQVISETHYAQVAAVFDRIADGSWRISSLGFGTEPPIEETPEETGPPDGAGGPGEGQPNVPTVTPPPDGPIRLLP